MKDMNTNSYKDGSMVTKFSGEQMELNLRANFGGFELLTFNEGSHEGNFKIINF